MEGLMLSSSLGAMGSLLWKLRSLLVSPEDQLPEPLKLHKGRLELLKQDLEAINTFFVNLSWAEAPNMMVKHWMNEVRDLSYDIEDYIDKTMHPSPNSSEKSRPEPEVEELSTLVKQAKEAHERHNRYNLGRWASKPRFLVDEQGGVPIPRVNGEASVLVGIDDSKAELIKRLNIDAGQRRVVCIQGSPGVGKTTLAKEVYCEMEGQYECQAFVRASKMPDTRRLLGSIMSQIQRRHQGPTHGLPVQELIDSLRKHLQQKRYLIVIDGLWETTSWDIVNNAFPDDTHCSRILITTDIEEVALECCDYESDAIFKMKPLGGNYSTELFFNRLFGFKHECSMKLKETSEEIIRACAGLPLATISIASILAIQPDNLELWHHVKEALVSRLRYNLTSEVMLREIVALSYNSLPRHLKTCLLYLSMYPEGYTFLKADLVKQWSAEGFIVAVEDKNCDEVAEYYFDELLCRGLIQPNHTIISDEVILYTMHSTVFEVIRTISIQENFCTVIDYSNTISELNVKVRRLSLRFSSAKYATKPESIALSPVRSLIFYGLVECLPSIMEFEVLRVLILDVWSDHDQEELDVSGIDRLFQLRYMRITSNITVKLPASVIGLTFLQTMEIYARVTSVPSDIIHLPRLVHLCVRGEINLSKGIGHMGSLHTLQSFDLSSNSEDNIRKLCGMTDLRDLHVICPTEMSDTLKGKLIAFVSSLEKLGNLKSIILELTPATSCTSSYLDCSWSISSLSIFLQRLELLPPICIFSRLPVWIGQLRKLFILKIGLRELTTGDVDIIAKLKELSTLSLYIQQPIKELIVFHPAAFPALKCFKFRCGIMRLAFQKDTMPSLQRLKLEFNAHSGEQSGNMLAGIEYLLNLKEITGRIGAAPGAEESEGIAVESVFKDAISKHPRLTNFNLQIVSLFYEECTKESMFSSDDELNRHSMVDGISELNEGAVSISREVSQFNYDANLSADTAIAPPHVDGSSDGYSNMLSQSQIQSLDVEYKGTHDHAWPQKVARHLMEDGIIQSGGSEASSGQTSGGMSGISTLEMPKNSSMSLEIGGVSSPRPVNSSGDDIDSSGDDIDIDFDEDETDSKRPWTLQMSTDLPWKLIEDITNDFAVERRIGSGGYGVVYKGVHPNGQEVAVKKLHHMPGLDEYQFQNEVRILTRICHPNIVQLVGISYIEKDTCVEHQGRLVFATTIDRAICLEYLPKGNLEKHLSDERSGLRWHNRYKIIKGICYGLKYLHGERIFHLNLTPSNILLDKDMMPKITDFSLSRFFSGPRRSYTTKNLLCTLGYAPPEFVDKGKITNKFDVFSLGVIIIKVLTGPDGYSTFAHMYSQDFIDRVHGNWREMLLADGWKDASYLDAYCNQVKTCIEIALKCVESNRHKRPSIEDIISTLSKTEEAIDKVYKQLFVVEPLNLCFPFEPDKLIPCLVHLTNNADHDIAYRIQPNIPDIFVGSLNGFVPARSTRTYVLAMPKQQKPPPNLDTVHVQSVAGNMVLDIDYLFDIAQAVHDESKEVKLVSSYEVMSVQHEFVEHETGSKRRRYDVVIAHKEGLAMKEMDGNDPVVANTRSSSTVENDLVGSRKRKLSESELDRVETENEENEFAVTGKVAEEMQSKGLTGEEMHSVSSKLLDVYPRKLQLPFKANKVTSCSLQLRNMTDDHVAVRLMTKCSKRYMAKMPICCIMPPKCAYTLIVTVSDQKKRSQVSSDEFLTLECTICLEEHIIKLQNANLDLAGIEFHNFFKEAKEMAADKVYELKLSVLSDPLKETTSVQQQSEVEIVSNRKFSRVLSVDVHPTEPWILTTNQAGEVVIWDYQVQAIAKSFDFTQKPVYSAKFVKREEWIVAGDGYGTIYVYSYHTEEEVTNFEAHDSDITSLAVHPTDPLVLSASDDRLIKLWDWKKNWECTRTFEGHSDRVTHVNFNPMDTNSFATASLDHTIKIWNISSPESKMTLSDHLDGLLCVHSYTVDMRQYLIAGSWDGTAQIWDMETRRVVQTLKGHARHISCVYHHPELPLVITGSHDGTIRFWNSTTYGLESIVGINLGVVHALGYIKDLRRIVIGCHQGIAIMGLTNSS